MENFKNEFQVFSPKLYLMAIVVGVTLGTCLLFNLFFSVNTEAEVWKRTSVQAIYEANQTAIKNREYAEAQKQVTSAVLRLGAELGSLEDPKPKEIFDKYFKGK